MKKKLKIATMLILLLSAALLSTAVTSVYKYILTSAKPQNSPTIIIDAGHGGLTNTIKV